MPARDRSGAGWGGLLAILGSIVAVTPSPARADEKAACIAASEDAQQLKLDGKLTLARARLLGCARAECPAIVRQDCAQWIAEVDAALPTVVLGARADDGHDLIAVRVLVDGAVVAEHLDGRPLAIDPGPHAFRFESREETSPVEIRVLARAGERNRPITATFAPRPRTLATPPLVEAPAPQPSRVAAATPPASHTISPFAWVLGGAGVVALGAAIYFEVAQAVDYNHLSSTCAGHCPADQVDHVGTERWIAGISGGVGVLALGGAALLFSARAPAPVTKTSCFSLGVSPLPGGGAATLSGPF